MDAPGRSVAKAAWGRQTPAKAGNLPLFYLNTIGFSETVFVSMSAISRNSRTAGGCGGSVT